jgi:hypothetical protein
LDNSAAALRLLAEPGGASMNDLDWNLRRQMASLGGFLEAFSKSVDKKSIGERMLERAAELKLLGKADDSQEAV